MVSVLILSTLIAGICFGFGYLMNPTNTTEYDYSEKELWTPPPYWLNWDKNDKTSTPTTVTEQWKQNWKN